MWPELLDVLREPLTEARLHLKGAVNDGERILSGHLVSSMPGSVYPIVEGVPRFVPTEGYTSSFGLQWNAFAGTGGDALACRPMLARRRASHVA